MANVGIYDMTDTWNNAGTAFTAIKMNVTDTASAAGSKLLDVQKGGSSLLVLNKSGKLLVGSDTSGTALNNSVELHAAGTSLDQPAICVFAYPGTAADNRSIFILHRSRGATSGSNVLVASGDRLGSLNFAGANGTAYDTAASIDGAVDGTPGATNDMPGRLVFNTTPNGSATPTERMRITSSGNVGIGTTSPSVALDVVGQIAVSGGMRWKKYTITPDTTWQALFSATGTFHYLVYGSTRSSIARHASGIWAATCAFGVDNVSSLSSSTYNSQTVELRWTNVSTTSTLEARTTFNSSAGDEGTHFYVLELIRY